MQKKKIIHNLEQKDKVWEIADSYTTSNPKSGDWATETKAEQKEIAEALKRKHKVVLLHNLNLKNGTFNKSLNEVENAARFFDDLRLSGFGEGEEDIPSYQAGIRAGSSYDPPSQG